MQSTMLIRSLLIVAAVSALVAGVVYWQSRQQAAARRLAAWEERQNDLRLHLQLDKSIDAYGGELPLDELAKLVAVESGLEVELDRSALVDVGIDSRTVTVILPRGRISLRSLLRHALGGVDLTYDIRGRKLRITTPEAAESLSAMYVEVYPLPQPNLTPRDATPDDWSVLITTSIEATSWDWVGGTGHLEPVPGGLVVLQTREVHQQLRALLSRLGSLDNPPATWEQIYFPTSEPGPAHQKIAAALDQPFAFTFDTAGLPMDEFFTRLADEYEIPIVLDRRHLVEAGVSLEMPISVRLHGVSLRSALRHVLNDLELTWHIRDEALVITNPEEAEGRLTKMIYPVHDLVAGKRWPDYDPLIDLITTTVAPDSWDEVGGPGSLQTIAGGWMIVDQTDGVHEQLRGLLGLTRQVLSEGSQRPTPTLALSPAEQAIEAALAREIPVSLDDTPLNQIARDWSQTLGINIHLDIKKLEEAGVHPDTPITCEYLAAPLRMQLERTLEQIELHYAVRDDVLLITTPEESESQLETHLYDVRPLTDDDLGLTDEGTLTEMITSTIDAQSWDEIGGPGSIEHFRGLLVVTQTADVHRQLAGLLAQMDRHCLRRLPPGVSRGAESSTGVPILPDAAEEQIEAALAKPLSVAFEDEPFEAIVASIAMQAGVPIVIDEDELASAGIPPRLRISLAEHDRTLAGLLDRLLEPRALTFEISNRQIVIVQMPYHYWRLQTRLYNVQGILPAGRQQAEPACDQLLNDVEPNFWDLSGGPGSYFYLGRGWLVVTADTPRHLSLADKLHELRTGQKTKRAQERDELRAASP